MTNDADPLKRKAKVNHIMHKKNHSELKHQLHGFSITTQYLTSYRNTIMMDDYRPSHFMILSSQQVWSAAEMPNFSESSLAGGQ